jgi:hypothetical protein
LGTSLGGQNITFLKIRVIEKSLVSEENIFFLLVVLAKQKSESFTYYTKLDSYLGRNLENSTLDNIIYFENVKVNVEWEQSLVSRNEEFFILLFCLFALGTYKLSENIR